MTEQGLLINEILFLGNLHELHKLGLPNILCLNL